MYSRIRVFVSVVPFLLIASQLLSPVVSAAVPNALPARHLPPSDLPATDAAAGNGSTTENGTLGFLRAGPGPAAQSVAASSANAQAGGSAVGSAGPDPAPAHGVAPPVVGNDAASAAALGRDACAAGGECARLGEAVVSAVEGIECRALHVTGKCSAKCLAALNAALGHKMWAVCHARCETDVVAGAAQRWLKLCEARQVSLIDQGKEAVKSLVVASPGAGRMLQAFVVLAVLVGAVMMGYRRGLLQGHALRLQRRMKKRGSDRSFV